MLQTTQVRSDPNVINFGIGQPQLAILPRDFLLEANQALLTQEDKSPLNYGHPQGDGRFRQALAEFLAPHYGRAVDGTKLLATNGSSHALHLISHTFAKPGDTILVEEPTYFLAHQIFRDRGLNIVGVPLGEDGVGPSALEQALIEHKPRFFYTIPVYQNPTGFSMSTEAKEHLVRLTLSHDCLVVADEVYQLLHYGPAPSPPLANWAESGNVLSVNTFSKILAPGLRLGWIETSQELLDELLKFGVLRSGGGFNPYVGSVVSHLLTRGRQAEYLASLQDIFRNRVEVMDRCLQSKLGDLVDYRKPDGGYFFWLKLPEDFDGEQLAEKAVEYKTGFRAGGRFSTMGGYRNYIRLSFAHYDEESLEVGVERLAELLRA